MKTKVKMPRGEIKLGTYIGRAKGRTGSEQTIFVSLDESTPGLYELYAEGDHPYSMHLTKQEAIWRIEGMKYLGEDVLDEEEKRYQQERHANVDPVFRTILKEVSSDT